ncbi:hypothetical protein B0H10DRAFT_1972117 [Mycena sp. CBHHK59/15]|nr:hypothetical protein B0H10DRAFT_1972117 [Mycena sp. CBHHK59/15]
MPPTFGSSMDSTVRSAYATSWVLARECKHGSKARLKLGVQSEDPVSDNASSLAGKPIRDKAHGNSEVFNRTSAYKNQEPISTPHAMKRAMAEWYSVYTKDSGEPASHPTASSASKRPKPRKRPDFDQLELERALIESEMPPSLSNCAHNSISSVIPTKNSFNIATPSK